MPRPFTRRQALENAAFLDALRRTGNARLAARELGVHRATFTRRRAAHAAFAAQWEAALAAAHAALKLAGGARPPEPAAAASRQGKRPRPRPATRTEGGELHVARAGASGRLQLRRAPPGRMTKAAAQAFLRALAATANVRLAAAAAGFAHSSFYARRRADRAFAREMRLALQVGYDRVEAALLAAALPESHADDGWRHSEPLPVPPMSVDQALQLLFLHEKSVRQSWDQPHRRKRRGEPWETYSLRLSAMWVSEKAREAEDEALRRAARYEASGDWCFEDELPSALSEAAAPPELPPLELVTGWSKAKPVKARHNPDLALFGGWRLADWKKRRKAG